MFSLKLNKLKKVLYNITNLNEYSNCSNYLQKTVSNKKILLSINKFNMNKIYIIVDGPKNNLKDVKYVNNFNKINF
tara:strand:+ start:1071 stop:1298 length:228 start_codon:yes stop_codon:yes gene_type:complete